MCGCNGAKDQTSKEVFGYLSQAIKDRGLEFSKIRGTGLFLVPAPDLGIMEYKTVIAENLSYDDTRKRGTNCVAYKWLPADLIPLEEIKAFLAKPELERIRSCFEFCNFAGGGCPPLCFCPPDSNFCRG